jgi:nitroreductase
MTGGMAAESLPFVPGNWDQRPCLIISATANAAGMRQAGPAGGKRSAETARLSRPVIEQLVRAAAAAPSMHNTQPWRFRVTDAGRAIELRADPARQLPYGDPSGRATHIACGAALFNLRLAAGVAGWQAVVRLLPDPGAPLLLATVRFGGHYRAGDVERGLHAAIEERRTNRQPFSDQPVPAGVLARMTGAAGAEGAILHILDRGETVRVLQLVADAERAQLADPAYRAELARWVGGQRDRDGIPDTGLGPRSPDSLTPVRDFTPRSRPGPAGYARFEKAPQLAVLSVRGGGAAGWLRAGQALQRVLLTATAAGIATCPLTQPLETSDAWLVRDSRSGIEQPQMIVRIGYAPPVPPTPRRPIGDILDEPEPPASR